MAGGTAGGTGSSGSGSPASSTCPVLAAWKLLPGVMERVAKNSRISFVSSGGLTRQCVIDNAEILQPIVQTFGAIAKHVCLSENPIGSPESRHLRMQA